MTELLQSLSQEWAIRALLASSMVGIMCGLIGCFIVLRNMSLIGDAIAHAILPGVVIAFVLVGYSTIGFFIGSTIAGLFTAVAITWIQHNVKTKNDAAIGIIFTAMFSLGVIGISAVSSGQGVHLDLKDFLFGTVLGISNEDIVLTAIVMVYVIVSILIFYRYLFITTFQPTIAATMGISVKMIHYFLMLLLSFAVVSSLRTVGVILVVAMLITPAATALLISDKLKNVLIISAFIGFISAILGLIAAILLETTPGPAMCVMATIIYFLTVIFAPKKGLLAKSIRQNQQKEKVEQEDIIKQTFKEKDGIASVARLTERLSLSKSRIKKHFQTLASEGMVSLQNGSISLTAKGIQKGNELVRAHRLWESYLVDKAGMDEKEIHEDAERFEHMLTSEVLDELDMKLGYPTTDPHGSPIPNLPKRPAHPLLHLRPKSRAKIAKKQITDQIESELWELGLVPLTTFQVVKIDKQYVHITVKGKTTKIPAQIANQINVVM